MSDDRRLAYVGLGSNLDGPEQQVRMAIAELAELPDTRLIDVSPLYVSPPLGPSGQPDYVNGVAMLDTGLAPHALLDCLQTLEDLHHRVRDVRWGARTLDLDLLLYGDEIIRSPRLTVPHPEIGKRAFVLIPLSDLAPALSVPGMGKLSDLIAPFAAHGMQRLASHPEPPPSAF